MGRPVRFIANGGGCASLRNGRKTRQIGFTGTEREEAVRGRPMGRKI
jgi:hypothetical protein